MHYDDDADTPAQSPHRPSDWTRHTHLDWLDYPTVPEQGQTDLEALCARLALEEAHAPHTPLHQRMAMATRIFIQLAQPGMVGDSDLQEVVLKQLPVLFDVVCHLYQERTG